jgi:amino acid transporter
MDTPATAATSAEGETSAQGTGLFVRRSSGLVRGWSQVDAFFFAFMMISPVGVGLYSYSYAPFIPEGSILWATVIGTVVMVFGVLTYTGLITVMPRAGGDYLYQSRVLHGSIGFVLAITGYWFIMAHWAPIYGQVAVIGFFAPLASTAGQPGLAEWFAGNNGIFVSSLIMIAFGALVVAVGMQVWAKVQKAMFLIGFLGLVFVALLLLFSSHGDFTSAFNREATDLYGAGPNAYAQTQQIGGYSAPTYAFPVWETLRLLPFILVWNVWVMWAASLHGEVRGASDFRRNSRSMLLALVLASMTMLGLLALIGKTMGWQWYNAANNAYWGGVYGYTDVPPVSAWPYPVMYASWLIDNTVAQFIIIAVAGLTFFGWASSLFIASTRVIFAAAFDRALPAWAASVSPRRGVPIGALVLMVVPSVFFSLLYSYSTGFRRYLFDATVVLVITFLGSAIAATLVPWRAKGLYQASPMVDYKIVGVPLISIAGGIFAGSLSFALILWMRDSVYGVNYRTSLIYMGVLYLVSAAIYIVARVVRDRQGMSLSGAQKQIPSD